MLVHQGLAGRIIGKGGAKVKELRDVSCYFLYIVRVVSHLNVACLLIVYQMRPGDRAAMLAIHESIVCRCVLRLCMLFLWCICRDDYLGDF